MSEFCARVRHVPGLYCGRWLICKTWARRMVQVRRKAWNQTLLGRTFIHFITILSLNYRVTTLFHYSMITAHSQSIFHQYTNIAKIKALTVIPLQKVQQRYVLGIVAGVGLQKCCPASAGQEGLCVRYHVILRLIFDPQIILAIIRIARE